MLKVETLNQSVDRKGSDQTSFSFCLLFITTCELCESSFAICITFKRMRKRKETQKRKICTNVCSYTSNIWSYIRFTHTPAPLSLNFLTTENWRWYDAGGFLKSLSPSSIGKPPEQLKGCDSEHKRQEKSRTSVILHLKWMRFKCQKKIHHSCSWSFITNSPCCVSWRILWCYTIKWDWRGREISINITLWWRYLIQS